MKIYNYADNGEYLGESIAMTSPLDGAYLIPRNATTFAPLPNAGGKTAVFNGTSWTHLDDFRGQIWYKKNTRDEFVVDFIGTPNPELYQNFPQPYTTDEKWFYVRAKRDGLLSKSDWTQLSDSTADKAVWSSYRQALRDIPQNFTTPEGVVWPAKP